MELFRRGIMSDEHSEQNKVIERTTYTSSVFKDLFSNKEYLIQLYQELHPHERGLITEEIELIPIANSMTTAIQNDLCFRVGKRVIIIMQYQTIANENIPFLMFLYLARVYEALELEHVIYRRKQKELYSPECYVIYTGRTEEKQQYKLSDSFSQTTQSQAELLVNVISQADGVLGAYLTLIRRVEELWVTSSLEDAIRTAMTESMESGRLKDYLTNKKEEVFSMLEEEFSFERFEREIKEEGIETGFRIANQAIKLRLQGYPIEEIAEKLNVPSEKIKDMIDTMTK